MLLPVSIDRVEHLRMVFARLGRSYKLPVGSVEIRQFWIIWSFEKATGVAVGFSQMDLLAPARIRLHRKDPLYEHITCTRLA